MVTWVGTPFDDVYDAPYGQNTIFGGDGNDDLLGHNDKDYISGDEGNDTLYGAGGNDSLYGGAGNDRIYGNNEDDIISGGSGNDVLYGGYNNDTIYGNDGNDYIYGDGSGALGSDVIAGGAGIDSLEGGDYNDTYIFNFGGDGVDLVYDSSGEYDTLQIGGVANVNDLRFLLGSMINRSSNSLIVTTKADAADGSLSEFVEITNFWNGSSAGNGQIEFLSVNGTNYWLPSATIG